MNTAADNTANVANAAASVSGTGNTSAADANFNIVIAGVGGQGTVLAAKLLAHAALAANIEVRSAETIGMAQRGGTVLSHVRIGRAQSPLVPRGQADLLIGFEPAETVRALPYLRPGGTVVTAGSAIVPATASLQGVAYDGTAQLNYLQTARQRGLIGTLLIVHDAAALAELGTNKPLNTLLLGAALSVTPAFPLSKEQLIAAIKATLKQAFVEVNLQALELGYRQTCK